MSVPINQLSLNEQASIANGAADAKYGRHEPRIVLETDVEARGEMHRVVVSEVYLRDSFGAPYFAGFYSYRVGDSCVTGGSLTSPQAAIEDARVTIERRHRAPI
ncbi:MAG: hypothetical protein HY513_03455 [Candidatus Aenigmarchaeota archaeon]|nr:hypothetical protein [Candidatus Aenigmarchaeota archaeon]